MKSINAELKLSTPSLLGGSVSTLASAGVPCRGVVAAIDAEGLIAVAIGPSAVVTCELLASAQAAGIDIGDAVLLILPGDTSEWGVVLGRVVRHAKAAPQPTVTIEATESLTLKCGEASVDLRADGKVMVRGEDVLLRAKGTQRIRAGNVAIN